ncbi:MAG TPA: class I SAM-dependent methyltransferase [Rhodospirillales bacterium]|nr:class I SAM-dependent methyltransferase [Rhodospirillales bacterium]
MSAPAAELAGADPGDLLRCPQCFAANLAVAADGRLCCGACSAAFAGDAETGAYSLIADASLGTIKDDIQKWWGDLYRQRYAGHEDGLDAASLGRRLDKLEDLFRRRRHLAAVEMPLDDLTGATVLEIGSGAGAHAALFARHGASVVAIDITPERVAATARKLALVPESRGRAYHADAENLPFRDAAFDVVYSNGVLHHSEDTERCINEVQRVLKPGGRAVIMLYARHSAAFWLNIVPRALITGELFRWPEAQWIGRLTEGKPAFGTTRNPITRVYSRRAIAKLFGAFTVSRLRKSSFQFDNMAIPRLTQMRMAALGILGHRAHPGGTLVYGAPFMAETPLELWLGKFIGFSWNIVAEKNDQTP